MTSRIARAALAALALLVATLPPASAGGPSPAGPVLTVLRGTAPGRGGDRMVFDLSTLERLGTVTIETSTPWTEGVQRFEGVPLRRLLAAAGATGSSMVIARAQNNYVAVIPADDFRKYDVILAFRQNGRALSAGVTGPFFLVYPYDRDPALRTGETYSRSVWQLEQIEAL
ncbi:MAG: molybdopterin-dependent oxidoreductase [Rhodospirillaceae bacterium]|nr:molybdopterin-dependent oxidoreductase [Rhodospirillaceae bacterium]